MSRERYLGSANEQPGKTFHDAFKKSLSPQWPSMILCRQAKSAEEARVQQEEARRREETAWRKEEEAAARRRAREEAAKRERDAKGRAADEARVRKAEEAKRKVRSRCDACSKGPLMSHCFH